MKNVKNNHPLVSICIPIYNGEKYLKEALLSAINQTYSNLEIIISDDNSKDNSLLIAKTILEKSAIPYTIINHTPSGIAENWNNAIRNSNGVYIKLLFQDDVLHKDCISKMVHEIEKYQSVGCVFCTRTILYDNYESNKYWLNNYKSLQEGLDFKDKQFINGRQFLKRKDLLNEPLNKIGEPPTTLIRRSCFDIIGYFDNSLVQALDLEYWYRIMTKFDLIFLEESLISFRLHEEQQSSRNTKRVIKDFIRFPFILFKRYFKYLHFNVQMKIIRNMLAIIKNKIFPK
ncbi:MAG TPA: hypothetical protein DDZ41_03800 [Flavobacterium sp.]|nr:hypothetical protein [Flavobacterium sp.]